MCWLGFLVIVDYDEEGREGEWLCRDDGDWRYLLVEESEERGRQTNTTFFRFSLTETKKHQNHTQKEKKERERRKI